MVVELAQLKKKERTEERAQNAQKKAVLLHLLDWKSLIDNDGGD